MEFDWLNAPFDLKILPPKEIEESFEDPFSLRLLPEFDSPGPNNRYVCLGKTVTAKGIFSVFWTDGKTYRVIFARPMTPEEDAFYERKNAEAHF